MDKLLRRGAFGRLTNLSLMNAGDNGLMASMANVPGLRNLETLHLWHVDEAPAIRLPYLRELLFAARTDQQLEKWRQLAHTARLSKLRVNIKKNADASTRVSKKQMQSFVRSAALSDLRSLSLLFHTNTDQSFGEAQATVESLAAETMQVFRDPEVLKKLGSLSVSSDRRDQQVDWRTVINEQMLQRLGNRAFVTV